MHEKIQACELRTYLEVFRVGGNGGFVIVCRVVAVISDFYASERLRREKNFTKGGDRR